MGSKTIGTETARWQELDALHHMHPFSDQAALAEKGVRVITRAEGCWLWTAWAIASWTACRVCGA